MSGGDILPENTGPIRIEQSIPACFRQVVERRGNCVAVESDDLELTYRQLDRQSDQVAGALQALQPDRGEPVALLFGHHPSMLAAILGVLKAGMFYVPLDSRQPADRLNWMLRDCGAAVLLFESVHAELVQRAAPLLVQAIDYAQIADGRSVQIERAEIDPNDLSYIIYTSGSTGKPKAVCHCHRNTLHCARNYVNGLGIGSDDRLGLIASYSVGQSISMIFGSILSGATLCPFDLTARGVRNLSTWLRDQRITVWHSVASVFRLLASGLDPAARFEHLRIIKLSGESVLAADVALFHRHFVPGCALNIGMGMTEVNIVCQHFVNTDVPVDGPTAPVGYPPDGVEVLLWDEARQPVAESQVGQIVVRSAYLASGYWRQPDLTRQRFIDSAADGPRLYLTGDLGRLLPDGRLVHMGRNDAQINIRGQRVEPGEVESALAALPYVREAAVAARPDGDGQLQLVAYVVVHSEHAVTPAGVRAQLARHLPSAMVPSIVVQLDALPRNRSQKIDRAALPDLHERSSVTLAHEPPATAVELQLADIWRGLLGKEQIGLDDDFFELGGDSLRAAQLFVDIEMAFGRVLPLATLFKNPSIRQLAAGLDRGAPSAPVSCIIHLTSGGARSPLFCLPGNGGHVFAYQRFAKLLGPEQPCFGLQFPGLADQREPVASIEQLAGFFVPQIKRICPQGPYCVGGYSFGGLVAHEIALQLEDQGAPVALLALWDATIGVHGRPLPPLQRFGVHWRKFKSCRSVVSKVQWVQQRLREQAERRKANRPIHGGASELERALDRVRRVNKEARRRYRPRKFSGAIHLFRAQIQPDWSDYFADEVDEFNGWGDLAAQGVVVHEIPGDHYGLFKEPAVRELAARMRECLDGGGVRVAGSE